MKYHSLFAIGLFALSLTACTKNEEVKDTNAPKVSALSLNGKDALSTEVAVSKGTELTINATFTDDIDLNEASIEIHEAFDGHDHDHEDGHARFSVEKDTLKFGPQIYSLSGTSTTITEKIEALKNVNLITGDYHLEIIVLDKAANRTTKTVTFEVADVVAQ